MAYDALHTIMPIAGWPEERAREVEISVADDQVLPTRFRIGPAGCSERAERSPRGRNFPDTTKSVFAPGCMEWLAEQEKARSTAAPDPVPRTRPDVE